MRWYPTWETKNLEETWVNRVFAKEIVQRLEGVFASNGSTHDVNEYRQGRIENWLY